MKTKLPVLTKEEREVLISAVMHPRGERLGDPEIAQCLGISIKRVKTLMHQACVKLGAHNRNEAIFLTIARGEIGLNEFYSMDEITELFCPLGPDMLRRIAQLVRQKMEHGRLQGSRKQALRTGRRRDTLLTKRERDVLILASRGLTNKEIADRLCMAVGSVGIFFDRIFTKLGASRRDSAIVMAIKQREISVSDIASVNELVECLAPLGAEFVERMSQPLVNQNPAETIQPYHSKTDSMWTGVLYYVAR
jgi:DNA-binding CsgD family transcriptional regulator